MKCLIICILIGSFALAGCVGKPRYELKKAEDISLAECTEKTAAVLYFKEFSIENMAYVGSNDYSSNFKTIFGKALGQSNCFSSVTETLVPMTISPEDGLYIEVIHKYGTSLFQPSFANAIMFVTFGLFPTGIVQKQTMTIKILDEGSEYNYDLTETFHMFRWLPLAIFPHETAEDALSSVNKNLVKHAVLRMKNDRVLKTK